MRTMQILTRYRFSLQFLIWNFTFTFKDLLPSAGNIKMISEVFHAVRPKWSDYTFDK